MRPLRILMRLKMKLKLLTLISAALLLAGCHTTAKFSCAGWTKPPKANDAARLVETEPAITKWIISTDRFGQKQGCWHR